MRRWRETRRRRFRGRHVPGVHFTAAVMVCLLIPAASGFPLGGQEEQAAPAGSTGESPAGAADGTDAGTADSGEASASGADGADTDAQYSQARRELVQTGIAGRDVEDEAVLEAMRTVPRHEFVPQEHRGAAYQNRPLPIGHGQTISQPYVVAYMTEQLELEAGDRVLEVGSGSGYQAAVLAEIVSEVYTIEIIEPLGNSARERLSRLGYDNVSVRNGDGYYGWEEPAPFDAVIVTAAAGHIPPPLTEQLAVGGRMVIPIGGVYEVQSLVLVRKTGPEEVRTEHLMPVRFVPMTGAVQE